MELLKTRHVEFNEERKHYRVNLSELVEKLELSGSIYQLTFRPELNAIDIIVSVPKIIPTVS